MKEALINCEFPIPSDDQTAEVLQPRKRPLYCPSTFVTTQFAAIVVFPLLVVPAVRADQVNPSPGQSRAKRITVIPLVRDDSRRIFSGTPATCSGYGNLVNRGLEQGHLTRRGRIEMSAERDSLAIDHHHPLRTFSAFGLADTAPPFLAETKLPSAKVSSQSSCDCSSSSDKNLRHILSQKPCSSHFCNRRQQVEGEGYSLGRSFQRAPLRRTQAIPSNTSRLSLGFRPPLGEGWYCGSNGSSFFHCSSVTNCSFLAMGVPFLIAKNT